MDSSTNTHRKLAAIMFTDLVGFSKMSEQNEKKALSLLEEHRILLRREFEKFNGKEIKTMGDGFLIEYSSSLDSINSAIAIQKSVDLYNVTREQDEQINLRIGIHLGDVEESDDDVYGDGVNIASRIESFAEPGGICVSRQVYDQINNKISFDIESLGIKNLKNITNPVELYNILLPWNINSFKRVGDRKVDNSIAVLPFVNMSSDKENEYFCDGLTEELLNVFAKEKDLKVTSRTSVFSYKGKNPSMREVADDLGVENILEGSVRKAGGRLRITAQLIRAADDFHLWSDTYDRTLDDIFDLQDEMASIILSELLDKIMKIDSNDNNSISKNRDAYNLYLEAIKLWNKREVKAFKEAIKLLEKAIKIDSNFSLAYCLLTECHYLYSQINYEDGKTEKDAKVHQRKAKEYIKKAEDLKESGAEFYTAKSLLYMTDGSDAINKRIDLLENAIKANPNYAPAHHRLSMLLRENGKDEEGCREIEHAISLDPNSPMIQYSAASIYLLYKRDYKKTLKIYKKLQGDHPSFHPAAIDVSIALCYRYLLEWEKADKIYSKYLKSTEFEDNILEVGFHTIKFYKLINQSDKVNTLLKIAEEALSNKSSVHDYRLAGIYFELNKYEKALQYYEDSWKETIDDSKYYLLFRIGLTLTKLNDDRAFQVLDEVNEVVDWKKKKDGGYAYLDNMGLSIKALRAEMYINRSNLEEAYTIMDEIKNTKLDLREYNRTYYFIILYSLLGDNNEAYRYLYKYKDELGIHDTISNNLELIYSPIGSKLRNDSRYIDLLKECKLYDYWKDDPEIKKLEKGK